jgi:nitrate reductase cytochrome c-type subunit
VCANARLAPADLGLPLPFKIVEAAGLKIAVTGVIGEKIRQAVIPKAPLREDEKGAGEVEAVPAAEGLKTVFPQMEAAKPDLYVLLSHGETEEGLELARLFPKFDLVLAAGGPDDPDPKPKTVGTTLVAQVGAKGKHAGVVGVYPASESKLRFELVDLEKDRYPGAPRMRELMKAYQDEILARNLSETESSVPHPTGETYVGAKVCGSCHKKAYATWSGSKHALAYQSLDTGRKGEEATWLSRVHDPECLACHVTGWQPQEVLRIDGGFLSMKSTPHLAGQQCENCHGPGSKHTDLEKLALKNSKVTPELLAGRKSMNVSVDTVELKVCTKCHDGDNSPTWNFQEFWPKVRHVGRD